MAGEEPSRVDRTRADAVGSTVPAGPKAKVMERRESCTGALKVARAIAQPLAAQPGS